MFPVSLFQPVSVPVSFKRRALGRAVSLGLLAAGAAPAFAADPVLVSTLRLPVAVADAVAEVTVLAREQLDRAEARTLADLLAATPGIQMSSTGGLGKSASLFVRGLEARHVLLLVDGVRLGSATLNQASVDNLPLDAIERIEIVRGPMSALYGSNAMGGVVQVFTRRATAAGTQGHARLSAGSHGYLAGAAGASHSAGPFELAATVQHQHTDGVSATNARVPFGSFNDDRDGWRQNAGSLRAGWAFAPGWRADALLMDARGNTQLDDGPGADARARLEAQTRSLRVAGKPSTHWQTALTLAGSRDRYTTLSSASPWASLGTIATEQRQLGWEQRLALPLGQASLLLERVTQQVARPGAPFSVQERRIDALAAAWGARLDAHDWQASLRRDRNSQFGGQTTGALAYAFAPAAAWRLGGSLGSSFTAPSFNQLYFPGFGNPTLRPEEGEHGELFAQWSAAGQRLRLTHYEHRYRGFISGGPAPANIPRVRIEGQTLAWAGEFGAWSLQASVDALDARNRTAGASFGKQLPRRARQAFGAAADWRAGVWSWGATLRGAGARFDDTANATRLGGYALLDLRGDWALNRQWSLGLRINNAGDRGVETALGYPQPGREAFVTLRGVLR